MSNTKITPHDWRTRISQYEPEAFDIVQPGIGALALVKNEQFALLIAAAPDLLDALEPFVLENSSEEFVTLVVRSSDITKARAAISKAGGGE